MPVSFDPFAGVLGVDIETASALDISVGADAYAQHESTLVWCVCFGYATDRNSAPIRVDWIPGRPLDRRVREFIVAGGKLLAFNVAFEKSVWRYILAAEEFPDPDPQQWGDVQAVAQTHNLPAKLEGLARTLGAPVQKDLEGAALMREMSVRQPLPEGGWSTPDTSRLPRLVDYCWTDVAATLGCHFRMPEMSVDERRLWLVDQKINARGAPLDQRFAAQCLRLAEARKVELAADIVRLSGGRLSNSTSTPALKTWLTDRWVILKVKKKIRKKATKKAPAGPYWTESLDKGALLELLERPDLPADVLAVLENRREANKATSLAKLARVPEMVGADGRLRNAFRFRSAVTGRWASSGLQLHNLPRDKLGPDTAALVRAAVQAESLAALKLVVARPLEGISQTLRSIVAAEEGFEVIGGDYSAIEARVVAWLAGQHDIVDLFANGTDVYTYAAGKIGSTDRQLGKVCTLGLGYGMGAVKLCVTAAAEPYFVRMEPKQSAKVVRLWREANPCVVELWSDLESAFVAAIKTPDRVTQVGQFLRVFRKRDCVYMVLPSGRAIRYWNPRLVSVQKTFLTVDDDGAVVERTREGLEIQFQTQAKDKNGMTTESTYGGKLAENATQAVACDLLGGALIRLDSTPYEVAGHVHDSIASIVPAGTGDVDEFCRIMGAVPDWAPGLPLKVDGYRDTRMHG